VIAGIRNVISERSQDVMDYLQTIKLLSQHQITAYQGQNEQLMNTIKTHAQNQINTANRNLDLVKSTTQYFAQQQLKLALHRLSL
jgi:exodeoxyribonuclease VII large subunit